MDTMHSPRPMAVPSIPGAADDDDTALLTVKKAKSEGKSAQNFLDAAFKLVQ